MGTIAVDVNDGWRNVHVVENENEVKFMMIVDDDLQEVQNEMNVVSWCSFVYLGLGGGIGRRTKGDLSSVLWTRGDGIYIWVT